MKKEPKAEKEFKASEIAVRYNVRSITVKRWIKSGLLPNARFETSVAGSVWLIPESDLENFTPPAQGRPRKN